MKNKMTLVQAVFLADKAEKLFERAARAWERGNNSGNPHKYAIGNTQCDRLREEAEKLLEPLGIEVDYPGLYPSFKVNGFQEYSAMNAISAALEGKEKVTA